MATAKQLPSGSWRVQVYDAENKKYISFTSKLPGKAGKNEAELLAKEWQAGRKSKSNKSNKDVYDLVKEYIESKEPLLSPSSIRGYYIILNNSLGDFGKQKVKTLTEKDLQYWVSTNSMKYKPKSVKSQFGLITAALRQEKIDLDFKKVLLPQIPEPERKIPNEEEISIILNMVEGTSVEIPVTIAVTLGLRQSEIAGLKWSDYDGAFLYIHGAKVPNKKNQYVYKDSVKNKSSKRKLEVEGVLKERLDRAERKKEFISPMLPSSVLRKFDQLCAKNGLPQFTMHEQRHGNASYMLAKGVPDKYAMKRLGHSTPNMLKNVYQHLYEDKEKEVAKTLSNSFDDLYKQNRKPDADKDRNIGK